MTKGNHKKRKWYRRLFSCFRKYEHLTTLEDHGMFISHPTAKNEFELNLEREGLLYISAPDKGEPVLDLCLGLTSEDLIAKKGPFISFTNFKSSCLQAGFEKIAEEFYFNEPIVDGLPASLWLECIEPTLAILTSLNSLKHRRSNLTVKKPRPVIPDSLISHHGDFEFGPMAILAVPRRITMAMRLDFVLYGNQINPDVFQLRATRMQNRRRSRQNTMESLTLELNINQSANTDSNTFNSNDLDSIKASNSTNTDEKYDTAKAIRLACLLFRETDEPPLLQMCDLETKRAKHVENNSVITSDSTGPQISSCLPEHSVEYTQIIDNGKLVEINMAQDFQPCMKTVKPSNLAPHLYLWNSDARIFEYAQYDAYKLEYMKIVKAGIKQFLHMNPGSSDYNRYSDRVSVFTADDFFSRRLLMIAADEIYNRKLPKCLSEVENRDADIFLRLGDYSISERDNTFEGDATTNIGKGLIRRTIDNIRHCFNWSKRGSISTEVQVDRDHRERLSL